MPGVVFLVVVPTANFESELIHGHRWDNNELLPPAVPSLDVSGNHGQSGNNLNINLPDNNGILRLEVELRDKNAATKQRRGGGGRGGPGFGRVGRGGLPVTGIGKGRLHNGQKDNIDLMLPMEKVLDELLTKLDIDHVTWTNDKKGHYYHVVFPIQSGAPCETTLHCLTELGIGTRLNSRVSVLPCTVSYDAITDNFSGDENGNDNGEAEELSKWNTFVESIKSKLTVKQVVDGVRAGGSISFDYVLLIVTADSLAALGLIENNAPNIVAAMLVSPLMGPVMSITFGTIISDRDLVKVGFMTLALGMFISLLFGFIFGLILGTTEMPWGFTDWPTEEMRGRGNARSLWMGVCWALTSGTGVAVALLQGYTGPLIGVAISASLLPPVVNCGLFWALACIWLIYPGIKMPHLSGEPYVGNSSYPFIYTNYLPTEFFLNGMVSGLLTVVNVICIFITAIIVLKIKEVAAPYTASPDLRRFWETDIRAVRKTNRSTIRRQGTFKRGTTPMPYSGLSEPKSRELETAVEQALREAADDETFRKVKRMSYSSNAVGELTQRLPHHMMLRRANDSDLNTIRSSILHTDLQALDKLVSSLLEHQNQPSSLTRNTSTKLSRRRPLSRSLTHFVGHKGSFKSGGNNSGIGGSIQQTSLMPTILEQQNQMPLSTNNGNLSSRNSIRGVLNTIASAPHRFSQSLGHDEENANLTQNLVD